MNYNLSPLLRIKTNNTNNSNNSINMPTLCNYLNCRKRATYGTTRLNYMRCYIHKEIHMKLCVLLCICGKSQPMYNEPGEKTAICCSNCKSTTMIDVKNKKCEECGKKRAYYNLPGETSAKYCYGCKTPDMIDMVSKKCEECGKHQAYYNVPGERTAIYCSDCKKPNMIDVKNKKCKCGKSQPIYNEPGETFAMCCSECKTPSMVDVISKKCEECGEKRAYYNEAGEKSAKYCSDCKTPSMVDVVSKSCLGVINHSTGITERCPYNSHGNSKYKKYCTSCFRHNFPLDPLTFQIRSKTKEIAVRDFINENFKGFSHNRPLQTGHCDCSIRRSIDHRILIGNTLLAIETDENQHKSYDKMDEEIRYDDLYMAHSGKWIYIRFNPDPYINKKGVRKNPMIASRLVKLKLEIEKQIKRIENEENTELLERVYMYYDGYE